MSKLGWLYVGDDGIEWSANHPVQSGEMPDARLIRRATNVELLTALKDAWEALGEVRSEPAKSPTEAFAWLVEAPGARYLGTWTIGGSTRFRWTEDAAKATRFFSAEQADGVMTAVRALEPDLWAFARNLGEAWPREHGWINTTGGPDGR